MSSMASIIMTNPQMKDQIYKKQEWKYGYEDMNNRNGSNYKTK
jgi:hypothetical protein